MENVSLTISKKCYYGKDHTESLDKISGVNYCTEFQTFHNIFTKPQAAVCHL